MGVTRSWGPLVGGRALSHPVRAEVWWPPCRVVLMPGSRGGGGGGARGVGVGAGMLSRREALVSSGRGWGACVE